MGCCDLLHRGADRRIVPHVGRQADRAVTDAGGGICGLFGIAADDADFGTQCGESLRDTQIDTAGASRDEHAPAREQAILECAHAFSSPGYYTLFIVA